MSKVRRSRHLVFALLALAVCALPACLTPAQAEAQAQAQNRSPVLARIVEKGELRVGMSGNQPPLNFESKSGEMMGLEVDLADALAKLMGVELEIVQKPFGELLGALEEGKVDLVMSGMTVTPQRNMKVAFVGPYQLSGKSILTKSSTLATAEETADLDQANLELAALEGSTSQSFVETFLPKAKLTTTEDYDDAVALLLEDKVKAVVADYEICALSTMLHREAGLVSLDRPLTIEPIGIAVAPGDSLLLNFLENSLAALEVAGLLDALRLRWLGQGDWIEQLPE